MLRKILVQASSVVAARLGTFLGGTVIGVGLSVQQADEFSAAVTALLLSLIDIVGTAITAGRN